MSSRIYRYRSIDLVQASRMKDFQQIQHSWSWLLTAKGHGNYKWRHAQRGSPFHRRWRHQTTWSRTSETHLVTTDLSPVLSAVILDRSGFSCNVESVIGLHRGDQITTIYSIVIRLSLYICIQPIVLTMRIMLPLVWPRLHLRWGHGALWLFVLIAPLQIFLLTLLTYGTYFYFRMYR